MSQLQSLPLYLAMYKLIKYSYGLIQHFPKGYKHTLGQDTVDKAWQTLDAIISANSLPNSSKLPTITTASSSFDQLKTRLRMAHELKLITDQQYAFLMTQQEEIGKMLSGWLKWAETK